MYIVKLCFAIYLFLILCYVKIILIFNIMLCVQLKPAWAE